ncbi:TonB-dependent receptor [Pseudanabaenaceae cyanobacterium LEGE 13415]|nr:TonB-dependent receptor [Pseudanabaenaceae cyanobacterium LEGE 13415]
MISIQANRVAWATLSLCASVLVQHQSAISAERDFEGTAPSISRRTELEQLSTQAKDLLAQAPIQIINSEIRSIATGFTLNLQTANGEPLQAVSSKSGNTLTIDIANAQVQQALNRRNPVSGIASIEIINQSANQVRITIVGMSGIPEGTISSTQPGLTIGVVAAEPEEEVVVTAEKRPENPQNVPISLTTLTRQQIEDANINSVRKIATQTPNLFTSVGDRSFTFQTIRGLGNSNYLVRDAISFYLDDVPYENIHQYLPGELFDLERVEVLRGPQGTLYGRSSQAGVINVISRPPANKPEFQIAGGYGNVNQRQAFLSISDAVIPDQLAFRLSGAYNARDGFTRNVLLGENANPQESLFGRANVLWTPSKDWTVSFNVNGGRNNDGDNTFVPITQSNRFESQSNIPGSLDVSINTQSLKIAYEGAGVNVTSITARNQTQLSYTQDTDYTPDDLLRSRADLPSTIWSQEIRIQSPKTAERFRWLVGGYYQSRSLDLLLSTENTPQVAALGFPVGIDRTDARFNQTTYAAFGQVEFQPIQPLTLTAGLRYETSREQLNRTSSFTDPVLGETPTGLALTNSVVDGDILLPRFAAQYRFSPNIMAYASAARGYKPGSQNYATNDPATLLVRPEKLWSYEVGVKSNWFDNRLSANLAVFWSNVDDYQILLPDSTGLTNLIANGGVKTNGIELEIVAKPAKGFDLIAGFGYTNARFTNYTNPFTGQSFNGNKLTYAPEFTFNLGAQYRSPDGFFGRVDWQGIGTYFFNDSNTLKQAPFSLINARIGYEWKNTGIYFFVNNLFDKQYITTAFTGFFADLASYGDRRTFGIQVRSTF